jgi:hypothetical protein
MPEPHLRAADTDRAELATILGEHMAAGRLTVAEYEERLTRAYAAKTYGELAELTADLPRGPVPAVRSGAAPARREDRAARRGGRHDADTWAWGSWASTAAIVITIWAITCLASWQLLYFWPVWVIGPWGVVLLVQRFPGDAYDEPDPGRRTLPG